MTIALWCILVAGLLPYFAFCFVSSKLDHRAPRPAAAALEGFAARANGAHLNAFEAFPPFAAAVLVSHVVEGPSATVNALAAAFIVARIGHLTFYLIDRPSQRSACFTIAMLLTIAIFVHPAFR